MTTNNPQRPEPGESHADRSPENAQSEPRTLTAEEQEIVDLVARSQGRGRGGPPRPPDPESGTIDGGPLTGGGHRDGAE